MADDSKYRWQGRVIKLTLRDYVDWKKNFHHVDLDAAMLARDIELSEEGKEAERKRWFFSTAMWLFAMHQNQKRLADAARRKSDPNRNDPFYPQFAKQFDEEGF